MKKGKLQQISLFDFEEPAQLEENTYQSKAPNSSADLPKSETIKEDDHVIPIDLTSEPITEKKTFTPPVAVLMKEKKNVRSAEAKPKSTRGRKSMKEMVASVERVQVPEDEILFQKSYYSIGKVAEMFQVNQSLIRLWEREFDVLKPKKNAKGDRLFRPEDIKNIQLIHHLTRAQKYTMEGAKEYFKNNKKAEDKFAMIESLKKIKSFLTELRAHL